MAYSRVDGFQKPKTRRVSTESDRSRELGSGGRRVSELSLKRRRSLEDAEARLLASLSGAAEGRVDEDNWERFAGFSVGLGSLYIQDIIGYPFLVVRRQCQVNHGSRRYHLLPFTVVQLMGRIHKNQEVLVKRGACISSDHHMVDQGGCKLMLSGRAFQQVQLFSSVGIVEDGWEINKSILKPLGLSINLQKFTTSLGLGFRAYWKGWGCSCIVQGIIIGTEICISKVSNLPRELARQHVGVSVRSIIGHRILKSISLILTIPFQSAYLVDSIQSLQIDDSRSILSVMKDAISRLFGYYYARGHGRLLPMYLLIAPSLVHSILHYSIKSLIEYIVTARSRLQRQSQRRKEDLSIDIAQTYYSQVYAHYISSLCTDVILYPLETVVMRLHVQGTRTIIDDTDNGRGVVPLCTNYEGIADCFESMYTEEGITGYFKGFGSLILQYSLNYLVVRLVKFIFDRMAENSRRRQLEFKTR